MHRYPTYCFAKSAKLEIPYTAVAGTRFVQPGKIEIDANERAVIKEFKADFSFAPPSILSLTICKFHYNFNTHYSTKNLSNARFSRR